MYSSSSHAIPRKYSYVCKASNNTMVSTAVEHFHRCVASAANEYLCLVASGGFNIQYLDLKTALLKALACMLNNLSNTENSIEL